MMKAILWMLQEIGVRVPTYTRFRGMQQKIREKSGVTTINWKSPKGNIFSFNDPRAIIANVSFQRHDELA